MDKAKDVGVEESFLFTPLAALRARTPGDRDCSMHEIETNAFAIG